MTQSQILTVDVEAALDGNDLAAARWQTLPPSHRTEYLKWINEAKTAPTRAKRVAGMVERLCVSPAPGATRRTAQTSAKAATRDAQV